MEVSDLALTAQCFPSLCHGSGRPGVHHPKHHLLALYGAAAHAPGMSDQACQQIVLSVPTHGAQKAEDSMGSKHQPVRM